MKVFRSQQLSSGILWASAIIASALMGGPMFLTTILLPVLGFAGVLLHRRCT